MRDKLTALEAQLTCQLLSEGNKGELSPVLGRLDRELETAKAEYDEVNRDWERDKKALQDRHAEVRKATGYFSDAVKYKPPEA